MENLNPHKPLKLAHFIDFKLLADKKGTRYNLCFYGSNIGGVKGIISSFYYGIGLDGEDSLFRPFDDGDNFPY